MLEEVLANFQVKGSIKEIIPWGNGHINDTYRVINSASDLPDYLLQRVNHQVFDNIDGMMNNVSLISHFIKSQTAFDELLLGLIPTKKNSSFFQNHSGYWRVFEFEKNKKSYDTPKNPELSYKAGFTYGTFLVALSDFPLDQLHNTIPKFHDIRYRIFQFEDSLKHGMEERINEVLPEIKIIQSLSKRYLDVIDLAVSGEIPLRVTHNDTKFNNVLLDDKNEYGIVIDLDTIMPGYIFFDVGDGLRSGSISANEDEQDLSKVTINEKVYHAFLNGYKDATVNIITDKELEILPKSGSYMAYIMAVRFLTDYINGDVYYKIKYPTHNLVRARCQLKVCELINEIT